MIENFELEEKNSDGEVLNPLLPQPQHQHISASRPLPGFITVEVKPSQHLSNETMPVRKLVKWAKICAFICILAVILIVITALLTHRQVAHVITDPFHTNVESGLSHIVIESSGDNSGRLIFSESNSRAVHFLSISIPYKLHSQDNDPQGKRCKFSQFAVNFGSKNDVDLDLQSSEKQTCFKFEDQIQAAVYSTDHVYKGLECYVVHWFSGKNQSIENCIDIDTDNWYGGGSLSVQRWPLNRANVLMQPFITKHFDKTFSPNIDAHFTSFLEPYFFSAHGVAVIPGDNLPLFVSINEKDSKKICLKSSLEKPFDKVSSSKADGIHLNYTVCKGMSAKAVHQQLLKSGSLPHPKRRPSIDVLQKPVWSTQGQNISNEAKILSFVESLKKFNVGFSQLIIDGNYSKSSGNFYFNEKAFPHSAQLIMELDEQLPEKTLKVNTQVYPFIPEFISDKNFSFNSVENSSSDPIVLDVLCEKARQWYMSQLKDIQQQIHVNGFRFSGGDVASFLRKDKSMKTLNVSKVFSFNELTTKYGNIASEFGDGSFLGSGYRSQHHGMIADAGPFLSTWAHRKGLKSIIPTVITLGLTGYLFVSAGPVGGVNSDPQNGHFSLPPEDLYIRWLQLSIFLPVIEFSVGPWEYGPEIVKYARSLLEYRQKELWPQYFSAAVQEAVDVGTPIIRPLWWIASDDKIAQFIDCEFLVSNHLLVAPVLFPAQTARDIYLPEGHWWQDKLHGKVYKGGRWLSRFPVNQFQIATFVITSPPQT